MAENEVKEKVVKEKEEVDLEAAAEFDKFIKHKDGMKQQFKSLLLALDPKAI